MDIRKLEPHEFTLFRELLEIFRVVFEIQEDLPDNYHLAKLLSDPGFLVFVVRVDDRVVGGLTIFVLRNYFKVRPVAYIYDVGISPRYQRNGLGKALIDEVCTFCRLNGFEEAYVEAEGDDLDAVSFYRKTRFSKEMRAVHFTYSVNDKAEN